MLESEADLSVTNLKEKQMFIVVFVVIISVRRL